MAKQKPQHNETQFREITFKREAVDEEARTVEIAFSSEDPVSRWGYVEVLDHAPESVRLDRLNDGAPLLFGHRHDDQIGVIESARIDGDKLGRAMVRFSKSARGEEMLQDVLDGIRTKISVGYRIYKERLEETSEDAPDVYRIVDWEPFEVSLVSVPADNTVGVGRAQDSATADNKAGAMPEKKEVRKEVVMSDKKEKSPADLEAERKATHQDGVTAERARIGSIERAAGLVGETLGSIAQDLAREAVQSGASLDDFQQRLHDALQKRGAEQRSPLGLSGQEASSFSMVRLLRAAATNDWSDAGFEREVCAATAKRFGGKHKGLMVPTDVLSRAVTTTVAAPTIQTDVLASSFIDVLRAKMKVRALGATVLGGLDGNISIPRQTSGASSFWVAEGSQPTASDQAFDSVNLSPKGVAAITQTTMQNLMQSSLDMEGFIRADLAKSVALAIDLASINGTGAGSQPTGILNTAGVGSVAMGANGAALADLSQIIALETAVADSDADGDTMAYLTNARVIGALKGLTTTTGEHLFKRAVDYTPASVGSVNGYDIVRSNQVPKNLTKGTGTGLSSVLFGNWADLLIGEWGALNLQIDPYSAGVGNIKISALQFVDMGVRHPSSFAAITDIVA